MALRRNGRRHKPYGSALSLLLVLIAAQTVSSASTWVDGIRVPKGYRIVQRHRVVSGVSHLALRRRGPDEIVHVARVDHGLLDQLRVLLSNGRVSGPTPRTERTTSMCKRARCLVAINGDFFTEAGAPVGGLIDGGRPLRSPIDSRPHFSIGRTGALRLGKLEMNATLTTSYSTLINGLLGVRQSSEQRVTTIQGLNTTRSGDRIILYTPRFGPTTETRGGTEITARLVTPAGGITTGVPTAIEFVSSRSGGSSIPSDGVVLSGQGDGASALSALWRDVTAGLADRRATLTVSMTPDVVEGVAGKPVLVRDGERVTRSKSRRDARTMIGWNERGDLLLVTVDGMQRGRSVGMSVIEGANLMRALGAVYAMNLDGGGSTTFVLRGRLMNRPSSSSHHERRVAVAVAIVPSA
ncbi:MAG: phosphodiester glycosidase family protein [Actinomycetota bacterium]